MKRRGTDPVSLGTGVLFLGIALVWLVARLASPGTAALSWVVAGGLVALGTAGLVGSLRAVWRRHAADPDR